MEQELWKDIAGFEGFYQVSNYGRVRSLKRKNRLSTCLKKVAKVKSGYMQVTLKRDGKQKSCYVHRLVYEAFNGPIPAGMQINHINEDKTDNRLENLNIMSPQENNSWGTRNERISKTKIKTRGVKVAQLTIEGELVRIWPAQSEAAKALGLCQGSISDCCNKKLNTVGGFCWIKIDK